MIDSIGN